MSKLFASCKLASFSVLHGPFRCGAYAVGNQQKLEHVTSDVSVGNANGHGKGVGKKGRGEGGAQTPWEPVRSFWPRRWVP